MGFERKRELSKIVNELDNILKNAGLFQPPPEMLKDIYEWAKGKLYGAILYRVDKLSAKKNIDKKKQEYFDNIKALLTNNTSHSQNSFSREFPINIKNWKYTQPYEEKIKELFRDETLAPDYIFVYLELVPYSKSAARYCIYDKTLIINFPLDDHLNWLDDINFIEIKLYTAIAHELQHFGQSFLDQVFSYVKKDYFPPRMPGQLNEPLPEKYVSYKVDEEKYYLHPVEFYPHLFDRINILIYDFKKIPKLYRMEVLKHLLNSKYNIKLEEISVDDKRKIKKVINDFKDGIIPFLKAIKKQPFKYRKAVIEIVRKLQEAVEFLEPVFDIDANLEVSVINKYAFKFDPNSPKVGQGRWRLRSPKDFSRMWTEKDENEKGISYIVGTLKDGGKAIQAVRFDRKIWDEKSAGKWWNKNKNKSKYKKLWTEKDWIDWQKKQKKRKRALKILDLLIKTAETLILYHGSPYGGLDSFDIIDPPIFFTPNKNVARSYAIDTMLYSAQKDPGNIKNKIPTIYKVAVNTDNIIDFRKEDIRTFYEEIRKQPSIQINDPDERRFPSLNTEGFISTHTNLPMWSYARRIIKLFAENGKQADAIWLDEGSQGISLAVFNTGIIKLLDKEFVSKIANAKDKRWDDSEHDMEEILIEKDGISKTRGQIIDYYKKNADKIFPYLKDRDVIVLLGTSKNKNVLKRNIDGGKKIHITKKDGKDDQSAFEYWYLRRGLEFHPVIGKTTKEVFVDLDPQTEKTRSLAKSLIEDVEKIIKQEYPQAKIISYDSGKLGFHVVGYLDNPVNTDEARHKLKEALDEYFTDNDKATTGIATEEQVRLDTTLIKNEGSLRAPYSMSVNGRPKLPLKEMRKEAFLQLVKKVGLLTSMMAVKCSNNDASLKINKQSNITERDKLFNELVQLDAKDNPSDKDRQRAAEIDYLLSRLPRPTLSGWLEPDAIRSLADVPIPTTSISAGTILYHGTSGKSSFHMLNNHSHLTPSKKMAEEYALYEGDGTNPKVLTYIAKEIPNLIHIPSIFNRDHYLAAIFWLERKFGINFDGLGFGRVKGAADVICSAGYNGFKIDKIDGGAADILLCSPVNFLELKEINNVEYKKAEEQVDNNWKKYAEEGDTSFSPIAFMKLKKIKSPDEMLKKYDANDLIIQEKIDGHKILAVKNGSVKLFTRRGVEVSKNVPELTAQLDKQLSAGTAILGEITIEKNGKQSISDIQSVLGSNPENVPEVGGKLIYYVYDILAKDGKNITKLPFVERDKMLRDTLKSSNNIQILKNYSFDQWQEAVKSALSKNGEGIVLKPKSSVYEYKKRGENEPIGEQAKYKPAGEKANEDDVIINSYEMGTNKAIFPAYQYKDNELIEIGKLSGLPKDEEAGVKKDIDDGKTLVVQVSYQERNPDTLKLRHMGYMRLRPDKAPKDAKID